MSEGRIDLTLALPTLTPEDYSIFSGLLAISAFIGLFYAWIDSRKENKLENDSISDEDAYLVGNRSMSSVPVALSLTASFMSSITVLSTPAEIYYFGIMFLWYGVAYLLVSLITSRVYMPFFYRQGYTSSYQYIEKRFDRQLKLILSLVFTFNAIVYAGIVVYAPAVAIEKVCNVPKNVAIAIMGVVCCVYTSLGGIKAVIWTDVVQYISMYAGFIAIIWKGCKDMGLDFIYTTALENGRLAFDDFSMDPRVRHSVLSTVFGSTFGVWLGVYGTNQSNIQRYLCCKSEKTARKAIWMNSLALIAINVTAAFVGLIMFGYYAGCDPLKVGVIEQKDQLVPYMVMQKLSEYKGLPGLFLASATSGTLSTVSSGINGVCAVLIDELKANFRAVRNNTYLWSRIIVFVAGIFVILAAYGAEALGETVLQAAMSVNGIVAGPTLGLFSLGMFCPWISNKPAKIGYFAGLGLAIIFYVLDNPTDEFTKPLSVSTTECFNQTSLPDLAASVGFSSAEENDSTSWFQISYIFLSTTGLFTCVTVALLSSFFFEMPAPEQRARSLYSSLLWDVPYFEAFFTDDSNSQKEKLFQDSSVDELSCIVKSSPSSSHQLL